MTKDMSERKNKMIELGDAFIAFPGGTGTLEEIAEVMSKVSLKHLNAPCILYNLNNCASHSRYFSDELDAQFLCDSKNKPPAMQGEGSSLDISNLLC